MDNFNIRLNKIKNILDLFSNESYLTQIDQSIEIITKTLKKSLPVLVCGNGGSASDAQHIAGELVGKFLKERRALNVKALTTDTSVITAWANDESYDTIFSRQVEAYGQSGGVLWGISTSGNSRNVLNAVKTANNIGMDVISMTGDFQTELTSLSKININVPSKSTPRIQELHLIAYHYICEKVEESFL
jgi:D-sedoheptulose 7-phosphate isomerase